MWENAVKVNIGVLQGGSLSPFLFIYYIDGLIKELTREVGNPDSVHFFADDVMVISVSKDETTKLIRLIESWLGRMKLCLNK